MFSIFAVIALLPCFTFACEDYPRRRNNITFEYLRSLGYEDSIEWTVGQLATHVGPLPGNTVYDYCMYVHVGTSLNENSTLTMLYPLNATHDFVLGTVGKSVVPIPGPKYMEADNSMLNFTTIRAAEKICSKQDDLSFIEDCLRSESTMSIATKLFQPEDFDFVMGKLGWSLDSYSFNSD